MARLIDADALMFRLEKRNNIATDLAFAEGLSAAMVEVEDSPTLSPNEVRGVGEWEDAKQHGLCRCSVCKDCYIEKDYITHAKWRYCPNCGAKMKGVDA